jgi:hypothetical protein
MARRYLVTSDSPIVDPPAPGTALLRLLPQHGGGFNYYSSQLLRGLTFAQEKGIINADVGNGTTVDSYAPYGLAEWLSCWACGLQTGALGATIVGFYYNEVGRLSRIKILRNFQGSVGSIQILHESSATPEHGIICPGNTTFVLAPSESCMLIREANSLYPNTGALSLSTDRWTLVPLG